MSLNPGDPTQPAIYDDPTFDRVVGVAVELFALVLVAMGVAVGRRPARGGGCRAFVRSLRAKSGA